MVLPQGNYTNKTDQRYGEGEHSCVICCVKQYNRCPKTDLKSSGDLSRGSSSFGGFCGGDRGGRSLRFRLDEVLIGDVITFDRA